MSAMPKQNDELLAEVLDDMIRDTKNAIGWRKSTVVETKDAIERHEQKLAEAKVNLARAEAKLELLESIRGKG